MKRKTTKFLFINRNMFKMFITNFMFFFNKCFRFYFFKLRLRGLGYRIKKITTKLYRFFFAFNHYFYFHISKDIFFKHKKRNLIIFSNNLVKLNDIFSHLLLLKKLDLYERNNTFIISKKILFFKKRK
jgi:ribosomal protein L6P/L9E